MVVEYPRNPGNVPLTDEERLKPGEAVNAHPFEWETILDFFVPMGTGTGVFYGIAFQLPKWGYKRVKIDESIEVSPVFRQFWEITIGQKEAMEAQIKQGLGSITNAISDLELVRHDMRKYKEFMDYFAMIEWGDKLIKGNKKEAGEKLKEQGDSLLKSIFIDQVDAHTGEGIALKSIAARWPTIISDFMKLSGERTTKEIMDSFEKKINFKISEAEAVVLATKNKLYLEWRDELFKRTVEDRFESLVGLVKAREKSVKEYKEMLKPIIARNKTIKELAPDSKFLQQTSFFRQGAQAISVDFVRLWAWRTFAPTEKYKVTRESFDEIDAKEAGFREWEINYIREALMKEMSGKNMTNVAYDKFLGEYDDKKKKFVRRAMVEGLPAEPSIDSVVRRMANRIQKEYGVTITPLELFKARTAMVDEFRKSQRGVTEGEAWSFSPYFNFIDIPMYRTVFKMPNGQEFEDIWIQPMTAATRTQNIIISQELELIARDMQLDNYIDEMLGEKGVFIKENKEEKVLTLEELVEKEKWKPQEIAAQEKKKEEETEQKEKSIFKPDVNPYFEFFKPVSDFFKKTPLGELKFFASRGPYEWNINHRLAKIYQPDSAKSAKQVADYFRMSFGVPGAKV